MRKLYFTLLAIVLFSLPVLANNVVVKGYITYSNGSPAANQTVWISTDSLTTSTGCMQAHQVTTSTNGFYMDSLYCSNGNIIKVRIEVLNCNGTYLVENPMINTATNTVERNFTLCIPPVSCVANFNFGVQQLTAYFNSTSTTASGATITGYSWNFGDGGFSTIQNPVHTYAASGTYNVSLIIQSTIGCRDTVVKVVTVFAAGSCHAQFSDTMVQPNKYYFLSGGSTTAPGDSITHRIWSFGDGTGNSGNQVNTDHIYNAAGTYNVCLKIISASGCVDSTCKTITVTTTPTNCVAYFVAQVSNRTGTFNSSSSNSGNSSATITARNWTFGDGASLSGNLVTASHTYALNGTYNVCLTIITSNGCQNTICKTVTISQVDSCHANFNYNTVSPNGAVQFTNTSNSTATGTQYYWTFGNLGTSTAVNPVFTFPTGGVYNVCLRMYNAGCTDSICKTISVTVAPPSNCEAVFAYTGLPANTTGYGIQFNSANSHATSAAGDSIRERIWVWGDGTSTGGNNVSPQHTYNSPATYNACLVIRTVSGCSDTACKSIVVPMQNQLVCNANFTYENLPATNTATRVVKFNSTTSSAGPGDSIITRVWQFGDGSSLTGNTAIPTHTYAQPGTYNVCLTITSALGCQKTFCKLIVVTQVSSACVPHFTWQRTGYKQISFNSSTSWAPVNDSTIERKWNFGDATAILAGNVVSPVHNYLLNGVYTVSLRIKTAQNCEQTFYGVVNLQDSIVNPPTVEPIRIISIFPNPATTQTQTVVWSLHNNVQAELAIYDIYGTKKWSINKVLLQGNNVTVLPVTFLMHGPYYFRVTSQYGVKSRIFFKN